MFKRTNVNFRWPATLSFVTDSNNENELFSRGHLRVFYKGETADHRFFSESFSEELIKSLPYTPIVSHYDEEKDDFVGHATNQDIYGIVDPCGQITFETDENNVTWAICDTVYYTERPDKVGEIAKKIEGHSQSLELDPSTVKYVVNYDERKHFKNIEFTAGKFVGVSVLGDDQEPAFTGSAFFASNEQFEQKMEILRKYCEGKTDPIGDTKIMNHTEFLKLSWGDISSRLDTAVVHEYGNEYYTYIVDCFNDSAIFRFLSYLDGSIKLMRIFYSVNEQGEITLGKIVETHVTYEDLESLEDTNDTSFAKNSSDDQFTLNSSDEQFTLDSSDDQFTEDSEDESHCSKKEENSEDPTVDPTNCALPTDNTQSGTDVEVAPTMKVSAENENETKPENSSTASFTESERAELETLKKEKKLALLKEYEQYLSEEEQQQFTEKLDEVSIEQLEIDLLKVYKLHKEKEEEEQTFTTVPFAVPEPQRIETAESQLNSYIRKKLRK